LLESKPVVNPRTMSWITATRRDAAQQRGNWSCVRSLKANALIGSHGHTIRFRRPARLPRKIPSTRLPPYVKLYAGVEDKFCHRSILRRPKGIRPISARWICVNLASQKGLDCVCGNADRDCRACLHTSITRPARARASNTIFCRIRHHGRLVLQLPATIFRAEMEGKYRGPTSTPRCTPTSSTGRDFGPRRDQFLRPCRIVNSFKQAQKCPSCRRCHAICRRLPSRTGAAGLPQASGGEIIGARPHVVVPCIAVGLNSSRRRPSDGRQGAGTIRAAPQLRILCSPRRLVAASACGWR